MDAALAAARPIANAHTIAEIASHAAAWKQFVRRALTHESFTITPEMDWPPVPADEAAWRETLATLEAEHRALVVAVRTFGDAALDRIPAEGGKRTAYGLMHGVAQHDVYHAGQIVLLKRAAGHAPPPR